jgi:ribonuclease-3
MPSKDLNKFQTIIEYQFNNLEILTMALTHSSYAAEFALKDYNERIEFLGDSVLGLIVADSLYKKFPDKQEGDLSQLKSKMVSAQNISAWAREISLGDYVILGNGQDGSKARNRENLLCDSFEALIGAIYLDGGYEKANEFVLKFLYKPLKFAAMDYKSELQELIQSKYCVLPSYRIIKQKGPDHNKYFESAVYIRGKLLGIGGGYSKKESQQLAAQKALINIKEDV